ncbi:MAG: sugar ABC transporter ATP-binding protein [Firmicutes bacterium]|nr:sugar ABC transporter ATP-binding protein [Bacillota bacterium]
MSVLEATGLYKSFGETHALVDASFSCESGEIHGIMGENGSGKSTLVKILSGILQPDRGNIRVKGRNVRMRSVVEARRLGVASISQEILVVPALSVIENIALGRGRLFSGAPSPTFRHEVQELFERLSDSPISLDEPIEVLPLSKQQLVVIVRALVHHADLLILDESTSALDVADRDQLFSYLRSERDRGKAIVYISHRIDELQGLADRMTILRNGRSVDTIDARTASVETILRLMSGEDRQASQDATELQPGESLGLAQPILWTEQLRLSPADAPIDFRLAPGEIIGLAGLEGHGQEQFLQCLAAQRPAYSGYVKVAGGDQPIRNLGQAYRRGIVYVPKDRKTEGLMLKLTILDNFALPLYSGVIQERIIRQTLAEFTQRLRMVYGSAEQTVGSLSGGNQQKVILARWLATKPRVLLLNDPTRGVDIPTKRDLYDIFRQLSTNQVAIVLLSTDLEELLALCRRVIVFREGRVFSELQGNSLTRDNLIASMFGKAV